MTSREHGDLGSLLKMWRATVSPIDVGLPSGSSRKTPGLRREDLAQLAGLSVDYVIRLEQGRARNPSDQVAASIARALQLGDAERDHLFRVAGLLPPSPEVVPTHIPPGVQRLLTRLSESPIAVFSASWDLLAWSPLWAILLGDPSGRTPLERNVVAGTFGIGHPAYGEGTRVRHDDGGDHFKRSLVSDLRLVQGRYPQDPRLRSLVDDLLAQSPEFADLWAVGCVGEHQSERKTVLNSVVGDIEIDCDVFTVAGADLRIVAYTVPAGSPEAEKLEFLRASAGVAAGAGSLSA
ncbi:helix-turn-helix transcriptional regulator [Frondihabitans peucedani]|uniref:Helix-turn-helix transcriptional regulator n=1 Tax=Frondihabitans peucedani TaxID=598626 RepID=A0ABP8E0C0_9MICO